MPQKTDWKGTVGGRKLRQMLPAFCREIRDWARRLAGSGETRRTAEITLETHQVVRIRRSRDSVGWCRECGREVEMVSVTEAMKIAGVGQQLLLENAAAEKWHICNDGDGELRICVESLQRAS